MQVSRAEMRRFAARLGVTATRADQLFEALDVEGLGFINFLQPGAPGEALKNGLRFTRLFPESYNGPGGHLWLG